MPRSTTNQQPLSIAAALFCATFCVFLPCLWNDFTNFDDPIYVIHNGHVHHGFSWGAIRWAFMSFYAANWHPITWLSHIADFTIFGPGQPWGHHLTSIILHSANVSLLFLFLSTATGSTWRSTAVAILFGVHPIHVESVAWIAERKDVLNAFFALLTLLAYLRWARDSQSRPKSWYFLALVCFALSLGSKPMSVTLPFLFLLLDYWPLQRVQSRTLRRAIAEKIPFFFLALAVGVMTIVAQKSAHAIKLDVPMSIRAGNAVVSVSRYLGKLFWPHDLVVFYPYTPPSLAVTVFSVLLLLVISTAGLIWRRSLPWLFFGWWWFLVTLLPVIGLIQVGAQAMADRYMYWPSIGAFVAVVWGAVYLFDTLKMPRPVLAPVAWLLVIGAAAGSVRQISFWKNSEILFRHALAIIPENSLAHLNLGVALADRGAYSEALIHLREAARLGPRDPDAHLNLGMALRESQQPSEAIGEFQMALRVKPDYAKAHANLAIVFQEQNDLEGAINEYRKALSIESGFPDVHVGLGLALQGSGQIDAALEEFEHAIRQDPSYSGAHSNRGIVLEKLGRLDDAVSEYQTALKLDPKNADASLNLPVALFKAGHIDDAIAQARALIKQRPDYAEAYFNLGGMLYSKNDFDGAIDAYRRALQLKPDYPDAQHNLEVTLEDKAAKSR